ncbi:ER lumen protein retaining receptor family protein isoform 2 [Gossypium australe]|uniref:ER lumen protein retaining receptor family protein isoform 2 n=1 Tax=Gossypium australe TaxID=47621 RepID=A0A5B6V9B1_9ROSI|nr:ER lumen protein retaining receptor family protein isoform 2 [Gossypium australe]
MTTGSLFNPAAIPIRKSKKPKGKIDKKRPIHAVSMRVRRQPPKVKAFWAVVSGMATVFLLRVIVHDHDNLFVATEAVHSIEVSILIYKLTKEKTCAGDNDLFMVVLYQLSVKGFFLMQREALFRLSLKSQELTAIFLAVRLYCRFVMEYDIHTLLDLATLATNIVGYLYDPFQTKVQLHGRQGQLCDIFLALNCFKYHFESHLIPHPSGQTKHKKNGGLSVGELSSK